MSGIVRPIRALKPCPFCGYEELCFTKWSDVDGYMSMAGIYCWNCKSFYSCDETEWIDSDGEIPQKEKEILAEKWNRRATNETD